MNFMRLEDFVSTSILARYPLQESVITIDYDPVTGESCVSCLDYPNPTWMDERELMDFLEQAEREYQLLAASAPEDRGDRKLLWEEQLEQLEDLCAQIKDEMSDHIRCARDANCASDWNDYVDACPSMGLTRPEEFILYWYIYGEFPWDMEAYDMEKVHRELQDMLAELNEEEGDKYWSYRCEQRQTQLKQIKEMMGRCAPEDDGVRMDKVVWDVVCLPYFGEMFPVGHLAGKSLQELVASIEQIECFLLHRKAGSEKETAYQVGQDGLLMLQEELNRCLQEKLGVAELQNTGDEPAEFQGDPSATVWTRGSELNAAEDIIACWYLSECFPWGLCFEQMMGIEQKLKEQMDALEAEEAEYETMDALELWRFRRDIKAEQLEQLQTMMRDYELDCKE